MERKLPVNQGTWSKWECFTPVETAGNQLPSDNLRPFFCPSFCSFSPLKPVQKSCTFWDQPNLSKVIYVLQSKGSKRYNILQQYIQNYLIVSVTWLIDRVFLTLHLTRSCCSSGFTTLDCLSLFETSFQISSTELFCISHLPHTSLYMQSKLCVQ